MRFWLFLKRKCRLETRVGASANGCLVVALGASHRSVECCSNVRRESGSRVGAVGAEMVEQHRAAAQMAERLMST